MNSNFKALLSIVPSLMIAGPALAQGSATPSAPQEQAKVADPMGEIVCQKQEVVGSRLATRRVCMTRLQWREQRTWIARTPSARKFTRIGKSPAVKLSVRGFTQSVHPNRVSAPSPSSTRTRLGSVIRRNTVSFRPSSA